LKPSNDSETDMTGANYQGTRFGHEKTSYAPVIARIPLLPSGPGGVFQDNAT